VGEIHDGSYFLYERPLWQYGIARGLRRNKGRIPLTLVKPPLPRNAILPAIRVARGARSTGRFRVR